MKQKMMSLAALAACTALATGAAAAPECKPAAADAVKRLGVHRHHNLDRHVKSILVSQKLCLNTLALPIIPIGDMLKFRLSALRLKASVFQERPALTALGAEYLRSLGCHF